MVHEPYKRWSSVYPLPLRYEFYHILSYLLFSISTRFNFILNIYLHLFANNFLQVELIKKALSNSVVELIQDLNGNHVIQRCLNRLSPEDNQFIYDAVTSGNNCVQVATHRHGCCVLQRCIDHASEKQKVQLIHEITNNALILVQDPYGNYVVQYVLELPFPNLVELLARSFAGHIRQLATQKFSSNVVEKVYSYILLRRSVFRSTSDRFNALNLPSSPNPLLIRQCT